MSSVNIESLSSLQQLLQIQQQGLYIDIYSSPEALKLQVSDSWLELDQLSFIRNISDSSNFVSGYNCQASINQGLYLYIFPGKGKGNITIDQHRKQISPEEYSDASISSYDQFYGVYAINGQTDYLLIQASGELLAVPDPGSNSLTISIKQKQKL